VKIPKIQHSQIQHMQGQVTLPELPNPALPNCQTCTGSRTHRGKTHCQIPAITLAAKLLSNTSSKHLVENIKNLAFIMVAFTGQGVLPELLNPALSNPANYTSYLH